MPELAVILPAAGTSSRFGKDKLSEKLGDHSVLELSVAAFINRPDVSEVIIVGRDDDSDDEKRRSIEGGEHRAQSVWNGLLTVNENVEWVAIHDAARPLVSQDLIDRTLKAAVKHGAAAPAMPVALTIKQATNPLPARVLRTVPRHDLFALQTPQIARRTDLLEAFEKCPIPLDQVTDDLQLLELIGKPTWLVLGEERNLKITTPLDLELARILINERRMHTNGHE